MGERCGHEPPIPWRISSCLGCVFRQMEEAEARARAMDRVVRAARTVAKTYPWHPGNSDQCRENFYAIEELQVSLHDLDTENPPSAAGEK